MKRLSVLILLLAGTGLLLSAQDESWKLQWHGMVNPVLWCDSRQVVSGREGMIFFYPKEVEKNSKGEDLNGIPSLNMLAITARLNLSIQGPDIGKAKVRGFMEGDFTGSTDATINCFRLRHAYVNLRWEHADVLAGQYWYPMVIHEIMPNTQPLNMGAPFHPYARYNQLRYTHHLGKWELMGSAAFQLDNKSQGAEGSSTAYLRNACIPELNFQLRYNGLPDGGPFFGVAGNLLSIRPRNYLLENGEKVLADQLLTSPSISIFGRYDLPCCGLSLRAQTLLNSNLYEGCTLGGYMEFLSDEGTYSYRAWEYTTLWADISRTSGHWRPGIFVGYGFRNDLPKPEENTVLNAVYGRGYDIENLYRIQPHLIYSTNKGLNVCMEAEYTVANYEKSGTADNLRVILSATYAF